MDREGGVENWMVAIIVFAIGGALTLIALLALFGQDAICPDVFPGCEPRDEVIRQKIVLSASSTATAQVPQMVMYTDFRDRQGHEWIRKYLYCEGREEYNCQTAPDAVDIQSLVQEKMDFYVDENLIDEPYFVNITRAGEQMLTVGEDELTGEFTEITLPINVPDGGTGNVTFRINSGKWKMRVNAE